VVRNIKASIRSHVARHKKQIFDCVIVWKFDRLGRSTAHLLQVLEELKNKSVRLIATSQNIDTSTPMGKFFFVILSGFAEMERELIRERIKLGLERRKNREEVGGQRDQRIKVTEKGRLLFEVCKTNYPLIIQLNSRRKTLKQIKSSLFEHG